MNRPLRYLFLIWTIGLAVLSISAQTPNGTDDEDLQSWSDIVTTVEIDKKIELYFPFTIRLGKDVSRLNEGRVGAGFVYKASKAISFTPFYTFIRYRDSANKFRTENRFTTRFVYKFPVKQFGLLHRSQVEFRFRPTGYTWRYRAAITIEKELPKTFVPGFKFFVTEEPFYDSVSGRFSKNRISLGVNKAINKKLSVDIFFLHQGDNFSHPGTINVIGTAWKIKL